MKTGPVRRNRGCRGDRPVAAASFPSTTSHVAWSILLVAALFAVDKLLGVVREAAVGHAFGASAVLDAYIAAFEVPEGLNVIVTGAALTTSLIPILSRVIARNDAADLWRFVSAVVNWVLIVTGAASVVAAAFARPIILTLAPGFADDPAQVELAAQLMRMVLVQTLIFSLSTLVTGTLQAHQHFFLPALSPLFYTLGRILGAVVLAPYLGIYGLAWGGLAGAVGHLLVKLPWLVRHQARWNLALRHPELPHLLRLMGPRILGMVATYINFVLPTTFGSHLEPGAIAAYEYGWKLMQLPETVIGTTMGIVILPTLAAIAEQGDRAGLRRTFGWALRLVLALAIPAGAGLLLLGRPLITLLLQRGAFDAEATARVYWALQFFALGLVGHAALEVVARLFYAQKDMWTPFWAAVGGLALNAGLGWLLLASMAQGGLALSNSLGVWLQVLLLLAVARSHVGGIEGRALVLSLLRTLAATAAMVGALLGVRSALPGWGTAPGVLLAAGIGGAVYVLAALLLGSAELRSLPRLLLRRDNPGSGPPEG
ncbi:MAG: murein biosynthesis integral membrane protein MurJ [Anaerolineae bacterium]|nr:murein biosynthesis integral membrane protein MurJ [Anaerolineae bacterium]